MGKMGTSARGERVDFDILAIKQQLASKPVAIGVDSRRKFIDTKEGLKPKEVKQPIQNALKVINTAVAPVKADVFTDDDGAVITKSAVESAPSGDDLLSFAKSVAKQTIKK
jgi:hypothetical protein